MLSQATRLKLQSIIRLIASGKEVSLRDRIYVHKFADTNQTVASWLNKARYSQKNKNNDHIDHLLNELSICSPDPDSTYKPDEDDLGEWFSGAPTWLGRS